VPELVERPCASAGEKSDNVTVLAVEWEAAEDLDSKSGISTLSLGDDVFASTIQASVAAEAGVDELDDAEIERSIREINEAISAAPRNASDGPPAAAILHLRAGRPPSRCSPKSFA
jgi:hypothetical protein